MTPNKISIGFISLCVAAMTSCSQQIDGSAAIEAPLRMVLTSTVSQTRSTNLNIQTTQLANGNTTGVFITDEEAELLSENIKLTADGDGGFIYSRDLFWPLEGKANIYAYGPYQEAWTDQFGKETTFTVAADQTTDKGYLESDLVYGLPAMSNPVSQSANAIALSFVHKLVKINITITNETQTSLEGATISLKDMATSVGINTRTGALGKSSGTGTVSVAKLATNSDIYHCSAITVPQTLNYGSKVVRLELKDGSSHVATLRTDMELESGKTYNFSINVGVGGPELNVSASTLAKWDSDTADLEGDIDIDEAEGSDSSQSGSSTDGRLYATFGTPGSNGSYTAPTYTWTAGNSNLMTVFEFSSGQLKDYKKLVFTISNLTTGASVRMGYYVGSEWKEFGNGYYSGGTKEVDLTALGIDLSTVTKISFGGKSGSGGSVDIKASDVYLEGASGSSSSGSGSSSGTISGGGLSATFGTPGSNASYSAPTYTWTAGNNNLMTVFEFSGGQLKDYKTLSFTISNLSSGASVRMGYYVGSSFTEFGSGYYSNGTKTVDLTALGIDLSTVTKISFGGRSGSGSVDIKAADVTLSK